MCHYERLAALRIGRAPEIDSQMGTNSCQGSICQHSTRVHPPALPTVRTLGSATEREPNDVHAKRFQVCFCVQDATVLHARTGKAFALSRREAGQSAMSRELMEGAEGDKDPCSRIRVEVSRMPDTNRAQ